MYRFVEASRAFSEALPAELVVVVWAITLLGSAKFLLAGLSLAYWNLEARREELLALVSTAFVALAVTLALKYWFDLPRPPADVQRYPVEPSPVGFPSGHAIAATVVYGGALVVLDRERDRRAVAGVGALVLAVGLSRVVLGVHYLGDVIAGFAVGLAVLGVLALALDRGPAVGFALAAVCSLPALVVTGGNAEAALALGGSVGALGATVWRPTAREFRSRAERASLSGLGLAFVGAAVALTEAVETALVAAAAVNLVLAFGIVALPALVGRVDRLAGRRATE